MLNIYFRNSYSNLAIVGLLCIQRFQSPIKSMQITTSDIIAYIHVGLADTVSDWSCCRSMFCRSYCYTLWSVIGIILSSVCLSVGSVYRAKSCTSVFLAGKFLLSVQNFRDLRCRIRRIV